MKKLAVKHEASRRNGSKSVPDPVRGVDMKPHFDSFSRTMSRSEGLEDMIDEFLSTRPESAEDMPDGEAMFELSEELERLRDRRERRRCEARES